MMLHAITTNPPTRRRSFGLCVPLCAALALAAFALPGCTGEAGQDGGPGQSGPAGQSGADGADGQDGAKGDPGDSAVVDQNLSPFEKALVGVGGKAALDGLSTLHLTSTGVRWVEGEGRSPTDPPEKVSTFGLDLSLDIASDSLRLDYMRDISFLGIMAQTAFSEIVVADVGVVNGTEHIFGFPGGDMTSDRWASTRKQQRLLNPHLILRDVDADPTLIVDDEGVALLDGSVHHLLVVNDPVTPITLWVNKATGSIDKATLTESDPLIRDNELEVLYYGWAPSADGLRFPKDVYVARDGNILHAETRTLVEANAAIAGGTFDFPAGSAPAHDPAFALRGNANHEHHQIFASVGIPLDGAQTFVSDAVLAPGVHYLTGGSHHSLLVEQTNGLVLIEAPLDDLRSEALLGWVAANVPGKAITHVVATHFHTDHAAGVRAIAAAGARVVVAEGGAAFFKRVLEAPSTVLPDALSMSQADLVLDVVPQGASFTIPDATRPVVAYDIAVEHAVGMLLAHVPSAQLVFQSDLLNTATPLAIPPPFMPNGMDLHSAINAVGLSAPGLMIAGGHGAGTNTYAELTTALGL